MIIENYIVLCTDWAAEHHDLKDKHQASSHLSRLATHWSLAKPPDAKNNHPLKMAAIAKYVSGTYTVN